MQGLSIKTVGLSLSALFLVTHILCALLALLFPGGVMQQFWQGMFPGVGWSIVGFLIGVVWSVVFGFYIAVIFVPVYNYLHRRELETAGMATPRLNPTGQH
jgi:ABC-type transporter Mla maintaining outer membrane lipid asymmetry permease subunit MlaE